MSPKYPAGGYGMTNPLAAQTINAAAARNNAAAGTSSWKMPPPSWRSSGTSAPSSPSFPSLSKPPSAASAPAPSWQMPPPSWSTPSTGAAPRAPTSNLQMPSGFSSNALGQQIAAAYGSTPAAAATRPGGYGSSPAPAQPQPQRPHLGSPAQPQVTGGPVSGTPDYTKSNAGGVAYTGGNGQTHSSVTGPGALKTGVAGAGTKTATDQRGRTFQYNDVGGTASSQPIAGVSNTSTVLRTVLNSDGTPYIGSDGKPVVYDTGVAAFTTAAPKPAAPPAAAPVVGRPTQTGQPVSVPTIPAQRQPTQDEIDTENQGRWLG